MDKKVLNDVMNFYKTERIVLKTELSKIDKFIILFPFSIKKVKELRELYITEYEAYGICIDALMNMIDYQQGKHLTDEQINDINKSFQFCVLPPFIIEYISEINEEYNKHFIYDEYLYTINHYTWKSLIMSGGRPSPMEIEQSEQDFQKKIKK